MIEETAGHVEISEKKPSRIRKVFSCLFIALVSLLILLAGGLAYIYFTTPPALRRERFVNPVTIFLYPGRLTFGKKELINILCIGLDNNYTDQGIMYTKNARSDTNFVVSLDSMGQAINVISIPRDIWVEISPEYGYDKINAAYSWGGISAARKCMEKFLGVPVNHYIIIRVKAAEKLIDAIGGLKITVEKDMDYDDNWGNLHIHLKKGPQVLKGKEAVGYGRFRHDEEGDWGRMRRQQQVLNALLREFKKPQNLTHMKEIVKIIHENIETDLTTGQLLDLACLYKKFDRSSLKTGIIKGDDGGDGSIAYIVPREDEKKVLVRKLLLRDDTPVPSEIRVGVLNGSTQAGQAAELADILSLLGYKVTRVADADRSDYASSQVIDHMNNQKAAMTFEKYLGKVEYLGKPEDATTRSEDMTIIIGSDWQAWKEKQKEHNPH